MNRAEKEKIVSFMHEKLKRAQAGIIADYTGINVPSMGKLRRDCRQSKIDFFVVKNSIFKKALKETQFDSLEKYLDGPTSIALSETDPVSVVKTLMNFARSEQNLKVKVGMVNGKIVSSDEVKKIALLPSREILLVMLLSSLKSPHRGVIFVLNGVISKFVRVLSEILKKKEPVKN